MIIDAFVFNNDDTARQVSINAVRGAFTSLPGSSIAARAYLPSRLDALKAQSKTRVSSNKRTISARKRQGCLTEGEHRNLPALSIDRPKVQGDVSCGQ